MKLGRFALPLVFAAAFIVPAWAQNAGGSVTGSVLDASGASVPNADVILTNTATKVAQKTMSTSDGQFVFPIVAVGTYTVDVSASGFAPVRLTDIVVTLNQTVTVSAQLKPGNVQSVVEVNASAAAVEADTAQQTTNVSSLEYQELPLALSGDARSPVGFLFLAPGVNAPTGGLNNQSQTFSTSINGGQSFASEVLLDGLAVQSTNVPGDYRNLQFPVDVIDQFTLISNNPSANYGFEDGGIISLTTKSGANQLHGDAYEYLRNTDLDARGFFQPKTPTEHQNEFGGNLGGPVIIPKLYNGKDKTFFFIYYAGFRYESGAQNNLGTVPTAPERNGDFSAYPYPIYDPASTVPDGHGGFTRTQFQNNIIPTSRIVAPALAVEKFIPNPTINSLVNNITASETPYTNIDRGGFKIDHNFSDRNRLSGEFLISDNISLSPSFGDIYSNIFSGGTISTQNDKIARLSDTWTITPALVNQLSLGFNRNYNPFGFKGQGSNQGFGIPGIPAENNPGFYWTGYAGANGGGGGQIVAETAYVWGDFVSWNKGKHTVQFGVDVRRNSDNVLSLNGANFNFSPLETSLPDSPNQALTGNAFASFLLGAVDSASLNLNPAETGDRFAYFAGYIMDDFKVNRKLTLNLGLRYDIPWTRREVDNRMSSFEPNIPNPGAGGLLGAYTFAGNGVDHCNCSRFSAVDYKLIQPRFGLAYKINDRTVFRGGFSIYSGTAGDVSENGIRGYSAGYNLATSTQSPNNGITPAFYLQNGYPMNYQLPPFINPALNVGSGALWIAKEDGTPSIIYNWTAGFQRDLGWHTLIDAEYVATHGTHLASAMVNVNQVDPKYLSLGSTLTQLVGSPEADAAGFYAPYPGFTGDVAQALRPYPQYTSITRYGQTAGSSTYNALQLRVTHQLSQGLSFGVSYTWSKWITDAESSATWEDPGPQNNYDRQAEKSLSTMDVPQNLTISYVYELPVGKGKAVATHGVVDVIVGGWAISGTNRYQSGYPLGITAPNTLPIFNSTLRPNVILGVNQYAQYSGSFDPAKDVYINAAAFNIPAPYTFGDAGRTLPSLRGFPFFNEDVSLTKHFRFRERLDAELSFQAFNVFNRVIFSNPDTSLGSPGFGLVGGQANSPRLAQGGLHLRF